MFSSSIPVVEIDHFIEQEGPAGGSGEPGRDELPSVGQESVAVGAGEQSGPAQVLQVHPPHLIGEVPEPWPRPPEPNYYRGFPGSPDPSDPDSFEKVTADRSIGSRQI